MTKAKSLDLDSQIQLLTRVQFITRFSSHLIHLSGVKGSGKTWLAHSFLEHYATDCHQVLLQCQSGQTDLQHRTLLLQQFVSQAMFNEHDSLCQSVEHLLAGQRCKLMIVIDDAHRLSATLIAELWALAHYANQRAELQLNIVLFAHCGALTPTLAQVAHGSGTVPVELDIEDLSHQHVALFTDMLIAADDVDISCRRTLKQRLLTVLPRLGVLHNRPQSEGMSMTSHSKKSLLSFVVIILAIIVLAVAGYGLMTMRSQTDNHSQSSTVMTPLPATEAKPMIETVTIDDVPLPPEIQTQGLTVGRQDKTKHEQHVVVSEQQIDAMVDEQSLKGHSIATDMTDMTDTENPGLTPTTMPEANVAIIAKVQPLSPVVAPTAVTLLDLSIKLATYKAQLVVIKPTHYALQLAATQSLAAAAEFIGTHNVAEMTMIYQTERNQQPWFIVVTGNYTTANQARAAKKKLSASLQQLKPWLKSYRQIQQEMNRLK